VIRDKALAANAKEVKAALKAETMALEDGQGGEEAAQ
jgi:hypothetical protein